MDIRWSARQRAAHYEQQADRLRRMAEAEAVAQMRDQLLAVAQQYQQLAENLKADNPPQSSPPLTVSSDI